MPEISHDGTTESATFQEANVSRGTTTGETVVTPSGKTPEPHMFRRTASPTHEAVWTTIDREHIAVWKACGGESGDKFWNFSRTIGCVVGKVAALQFQADVQFDFVKNTAPVHEATPMHDKPGWRSVCVVFVGPARVPREYASGFCRGHCIRPRCSVNHQGRPGGTSPGCISPPAPPTLSGFNKGAVAQDLQVLSRVCRIRSCSVRVHSECSSNRCTLHCSSLDCPLHSCLNGSGAGTRQVADPWTQ